MNVKALIQSIPRPAKLAILIVVVSKVLVLAVGYSVNALNAADASPLSIVMGMFNRWDAPHYVDIAKDWYVNTGDAANFIAFFPLYPILIRAFTVSFEYINLSALIASNVCSVIAFFYLYKLAKMEFNSDVAVRAVLFLSVFPTAYFLVAPYTEGLFFALTIACVYYARLGRWPLAGVLGLFAALSRIAGLLLLPVLLVEYFHQRGWKLGRVKLSVVWVFLALGGFLVYLAINFQVTGDAFAFLTVQREHWSNTFDPWTGLTRAFSWAANATYPENITIGVAPIGFGVFGLLMVAAAVWRRMRPVYVVYLFLSWGLAVSTSWWISVPRYVMAMFPMFMLLGVLSKRKTVTVAVVLVSGVLLVFFTVFFAFGWWAF